VQATKFGLNLKPPTQIGTTIPPSGWRVSNQPINSQLAMSQTVAQIEFTTGVPQLWATCEFR
jgi:hypothetical protein